MTRRAKLLLIGEDFPIKQKTIIRTPSKKAGYKYNRELKLKSKTVEVNIDVVREGIKVLQEKYPDKGFFFERHAVINMSAPEEPSYSDQQAHHRSRTMVCWIIGRRNPDPKLRRKDVPIYWCPRFSRLYVPKSYYDRSHRLTCSVISYRLRDLGVPYNLPYT